MGTAAADGERSLLWCLRATAAALVRGGVCGWVWRGEPL